MLFGIIKYDFSLLLMTLKVCHTKNKDFILYQDECLLS